MGQGCAKGVAAWKSWPVPCVLDQNPEQLQQLAGWIEELGYQALPTADPEEALEMVRLGRCGLVLADLRRTELDTYGFVERALRNDPGARVIVMSDGYTQESAREALQRGAMDFLPKPVDPKRLKETLEEEAALYDRRRRVGELEDRLLENLEFHGMVGRSPAMLNVFDFARKVARHSGSALVTGEPGTGKEVLARAIHQRSPARQQQLAVCDCSALTDSALQSQLFGHQRGSFAGATETRAGMFEGANGGTVLLDEVGETSRAMQGKLLRVIQNRETQRLGSREVLPVQVRVIAASHGDLRADVLAGRFREDLYNRLSSMQVRIPALEERLGDIPLLAQYFLKKYNQVYGKKIGGLTRRAQAVLLQHRWPGNVRELENVISSACITAGEDFIDLRDLPDSLQRLRGMSRPAAEDGMLSLDEVRKAHIARVLHVCHGNRLRAARVLGIGRTSLYRYLKRDSEPDASVSGNRPARNDAAGKESVA
jgi:two-component system response regulator HydG